MKELNGFKPYAFQKETIQKAVQTIQLVGGVCIFDETGLGKTITGATIAKNVSDGKILIISPKANKGGWTAVLPEATVCTKQKIESGDYDVVIVDEAHHFSNVKNKSHADLTKTIFGGTKLPKVILLTATPVNNNISELYAMFRLIPFKLDSLQYHVLPIALSNAMKDEKELRKFEQFNVDKDGMGKGGKAIVEHVDKRWSLNKSMEALGGVMKTFCYRTTRKEIEQKYESDVELMGHFPKVNHYPVSFQGNDKLLFQTIKLVERLSMAYYNKVNYMEGNQHTGLGGIMNTFLLKRLDSSISAFFESLNNFKNTFEQELSNGCEEIVRQSYWDDLKEDLDVVGRLFEIWADFTGNYDTEKLDRLVEIIRESEGKVVVFTEYNETQRIIFERLSAEFKTLQYNGKTDEKVLDTIALEFDRNAEKNTNDFKVLVATDALAEGVNLHKATTLIHFDLKWNPSRLIQREGRINRLVKNGVPVGQIAVHTFSVDTLVESIIKLEKRLDNKKSMSEILLESNWKLKLVKDEIPEGDYITKDVNCGSINMVKTVEGFVFITEGYGNGTNVWNSNLTVSIQKRKREKQRTYFFYGSRGILTNFGYPYLSDFNADICPNREDKPFLRYLYQNPMYGSMLWEMLSKNKDVEGFKALVQLYKTHYNVNQITERIEAGNWMVDDDELDGEVKVI